MPAAPPPLHTLRTHSVPIASTSFSHDNALIYAGDQDGYLSITDAKTRRAIAYWKAHTEGILGVQEWDNRLIS
jgi:WD40 repeat protein